MRIAPSLQLTEPERQQLTPWARGRRTPARLVLRAKIALLAAEGHDRQPAHGRCPGHESANRRPVAAPRRNPAPARPRSGCATRRAPPKPRQALIARMLKTTTQTTPPGATHWSTRTVARYLGTNPTFVQRVWTAHGLQPHRVRAFTLSQDPYFQDKLEDVVGLSLHPPEPAVVLSVDEKSQIQALDRTRPAYP